MNEDSVAEYIMKTFSGVETTANSGTSSFFTVPITHIPYRGMAGSDFRRRTDERAF
jgi:hypothetical protein